MGRTTLRRDRRAQAVDGTAVVPLASLTPDPDNRRTHPDRNLAMISDALRQVGAARSIVIDEHGVILAGNGVTSAAIAAGLTSARIIDADGDELIAVRRRGLTPDQKRTLALFDNRTGELAAWDLELLRVDAANGVDLQPFWTAEELAALFAGHDPDVKVGLTDPDDVPPPRATAVLPGDVFALGDHRLLCGDSTDAAGVRRVLDADARTAFAFTSPPYLDARTYGDGQNQAVAHLAQFLPACADLVDVIAVNLGLIRRNGAIARYWDDYITTAERAGLRLLSWNIWHQGVQGSPAKLSAMFPIEHEFILVFGAAATRLRKTVANKHAGEGRRPRDRQADGTTKKKPRVEIAPRRALGTVVVTPSENTREPGVKDHPARFPVALVVPYLLACCDAGDAVYEPFCGSGTTIIACEQTRRRCRGVELEPRWVQVAIDRWEAFTGQKARKIGAAVVIPDPDVTTPKARKKR